MQPRKNKILFYYLSAFSQTGGIEKFNRCFIKALNAIDADRNEVSVVSVYDKDSDERYNPRSKFKAFGGKRSASLSYTIRQAKDCDVFILGHINLAVAGLIVRLINPRCKLVVIAHGIEVWDKLSFLRKWCLEKASMILSVSNYTKNQLVLRNHIEPGIIRLFPNTIDPYFKVPGNFSKPVHLRQRFGVGKDQKVILTLCRLSSSEKNKGYDIVIAALPSILSVFPDTVYILAGKYDAAEQQRISDVVRFYNVEAYVKLAGFIADEDLPDLYKMADTFIMPSRKEGFGIVFLEALACGTNVIGGNQDGTVDALHNGALGKLVNPANTSEVSEAVIEQLQKKISRPEAIQKRVLDQYRFVRFKERLENCLQELNSL
jgi:phosphatidyl-myo-inositol dimannoside synthase